MQVWALHPKYLSRRQLQVSWDDGLEALKILSQPNKYRRFYSGISVFRVQSEPVFTLVRYLEEIAKEGKKRGLDMDTSILPTVPKEFRVKIPVSTERIASEMSQLTRQLARLGRWHVRKLQSMRTGRIHPLFFLETSGRPSAWELLGRIRLSR